MIADIALPIPYDWFLLGSRLVIAAILLVFLWRVMIVVGRDALWLALPVARSPWLSSMMPIARCEASGSRVANP